VARPDTNNWWAACESGGASAGKKPAAIVAEQVAFPQRTQAARHTLRATPSRPINPLRPDTGSDTGLSDSRRTVCGSHCSRGFK
jgi:hypothetical protein